MAKAKVDSGPTALDPEMVDAPADVSVQVAQDTPPEVAINPLTVAASSAGAAKLSAQTAESAVIEAERIFDGLLPAATSTALDGRIHSVEEIERGYTLVNEAFAARQAARTALVAAWADQDAAETTLIDLEHAALLEARRVTDLTGPTA